MKLLILLISLANISFAEVENLPLRGEGSYSWLFINVYDAALFAPAGDDIYNKEFRLDLKYKRAFDGEDIAKQSEKEMLSAGVDKSLIKKWQSRMRAVFPNVKKGDVISAKFKPNVGVSFKLNRVKDLGSFNDVEFSKHFLNIWLGEKTSDPKLRRKLLGR